MHEPTWQCRPCRGCPSTGASPPASAAVLGKPVSSSTQASPSISGDPLATGAPLRPGPRGSPQGSSGGFVIGLPTKPRDHRLKRLAGTLLDQPPQVQPAVCQLHRAVGRLGEHLARQTASRRSHRRRAVCLRRCYCLATATIFLLASRSLTQGDAPRPGRALPQTYQSTTRRRDF